MSTSQEYRTYRLGDLAAEVEIVYAPRWRWKPPQITLKTVTFPGGYECTSPGDYARMLAVGDLQADLLPPEDWEEVERQCRQRYADGLADTAAMLGLTGALAAPFRDMTYTDPAA
jgi:hypothetical protein